MTLNSSADPSDDLPMINGTDERETLFCTDVAELIEDMARSRRLYLRLGCELCSDAFVRRGMWTFLFPATPLLGHRRKTDRQAVCGWVKPIALALLG